MDGHSVIDQTAREKVQCPGFVAGISWIPMSSLSGHTIQGRMLNS